MRLKQTAEPEPDVWGAGCSASLHDIVAIDTAPFLSRAVEEQCFHQSIE